MLARLRRFFRTTLNPAGYHGPLPGDRLRKPYFEGWYFKVVDPQESARLAIIPGVFWGRKGEESHAFIQVLNGVTGEVSYHNFPIEEFQAAETGFQVQIGKNRFSAAGISLDIADAQRTVRGELRFQNPAPSGWPVTLLSPGIMGWYAWVPLMECYHGVLSFHHGLEGELCVDGLACQFTGGHGYIEKDWGRSFPSAWVWTQTNHFQQPGVCLTGSIAIIPWVGQAFPGFIVGLWFNGQLYRFATYTGARTTALEIGENQVDWVISDRRHTLELTAYRAQGGLLKAPTPSGMDRRIAETLDGRVRVRLSRHAGNGSQVLFEEEGRHAGLEAVGDLDRLCKMLFPRKG